MATNGSEIRCHICGALTEVMVSTPTAPGRAGPLAVRDEGWFQQERAYLCPQCFRDLPDRTGWTPIPTA
jgi:hypothetical protein